MVFLVLQGDLDTVLQGDTDMVFLDLLGVVFLVTVFFDLAFNLPGDPGTVSFDFEDWDDFCNHYIYESCMNITVYTHRKKAVALQGKVKCA